ncbi:hypothetical protein TNCV_3181531 [Trichonephila clavipes]|nr:hypothetical protein TNCV_3181531 [Trichonephila clavipes]
MHNCHVVSLEVDKSVSRCAQRIPRSRASHSCWIPSKKIYGAGRGGDVITGEAGEQKIDEFPSSKVGFSVQ